MADRGAIRRVHRPRRRIARRSLASIAVLAVTAACGPSPPEAIDTYASLLALAPGARSVKGEAVRELVLDIGGDRRPALYQHPPSRVALGPLPAGEACELRFALAIRESAWSKSDGVQFRATLHAGGAERVVFEEWLATTGAPRWHDRTVALETLDPVSAPSLVLETGPGPAGDRGYDQAGWGEPRVVCRGRDPGQPAAAPPNVVLVSIDTLRADRLGVYGYERRTSPAIDELATSSLVFTQAFAPSPWTLPSHASMFTGLLPHEHGAGHVKPSAPLAPERTTLAEILQSAGYRTVAFSAGGFASGRYGLAQGFDRWVERPRANLRAVLPEVFDALAPRRRRPLFLFLHTYDVHGPYLAWEDEAPDDASTALPSPPQALPEEEWERIRSIDYHDYQLLERFGSLAELVAAYDGGVRHVDAQIGRLLRYLRQAGLYEDTLLIVTSDHGESLYEDRFYIGHSYTVAEREIRVPLIVRLPGASQQGPRSELVSLTDLAPLVLDVLGLGRSEGMSGRSPLLRDGAAGGPRQQVRGEAVHTGVRFVRSRRWKVLAPARSPDDPRSQLPPSLADRFDPRGRVVELGADGSERRIVALGGREEGWPDGLDALWRAVRTTPQPGRDIASGSPEVDSEQAEELRALGYIQ